MKLKRLDNNQELKTVYVLYYDIMRHDGKKDYALVEDSNLAKLAKINNKMSILGCRNAVIGCQYGKWKLKREPDKDDTINVSLFFYEDGPSNIDDPIKEEKKGEEIWTGEGELKLPDFTKFVEFLRSMFLQHKLTGGQNK